MDLALQHDFRLGVAQVRPATREVLWPSGHATLEPRAMQVLVALSRAGGDVVTRDRLIAECWSGNAVGDDAVSRIISRLRRLSADAGANTFAIETITKVGFRLTADVVPPPPPDNTAVSRRPLLVAAALGAVAVAGGSALLLRRKPASSQVTRVAVLPFEQLGSDRSAAYLASGLTRQIRDELSRVAGLQVIAEPSSASISAARLSATEAGARLGASMLVQGSVRQQGDRVRVIAAIVDPRDSGTVWSQTDEGSAADQFALQDRVSGSLLREIVGRTGAIPVTRTPDRPRDARAWMLVQKGQDLLEANRTARMNGRETAAFDAADGAWRAAQDALAIDARDVGATLLVAQLVRNGWTRALASQPLTADQRAARSAAYVTNALTVDPNDPSALAALGDYYRRFLWRWEDAERLLRKALAINPSHTDALWSLAYLLGTTGRCVEGLGCARALFQLDPESTWRRVALPRLLYIAGDRAGAFRRYAIELATTPGNLFLITEIYVVHLTEGDAGAIDALVSRVRQLNSGRRGSVQMTDLLTRLTDAANALRGRPISFLTRIDGDIAAYDAATSANVASRGGRASIDTLFIHAIEYAWAGATRKAIQMLGRALQGHSVYWPATLPYGNAQFPVSVRREPAYAALWRSDPALSMLVTMRRAAVVDRQMAGVLPDGRFVRPAKDAFDKTRRGV